MDVLAHAHDGDGELEGDAHERQPDEHEDRPEDKGDDAGPDAHGELLDDDEDNIIGCVLAKSQGVERVIAVVQRSNYLDLLSHIGVDHPFSPRVVAAKEIEQTIDDAPVRVLTNLFAGAIDAYRVRAAEGAALLGKSLRELKISPDYVIAAIRRGENVWVPGGDDTIEKDDIVLVIGRHGMEKQLKQMLRT